MSDKLKQLSSEEEKQLFELANQNLFDQVIQYEREGYDITSPVYSLVCNTSNYTWDLSLLHFAAIHRNKLVLEYLLSKETFKLLYYSQNPYHISVSDCYILGSDIWSYLPNSSSEIDGLNRLHLSDTSTHVTNTHDCTTSVDFSLDNNLISLLLDLECPSNVPNSTNTTTEITTSHETITSRENSVPNNHFFMGVGVLNVVYYCKSPQFDINILHKIFHSIESKKIHYKNHLTNNLTIKDNYKDPLLTLYNLDIVKTTDTQGYSALANLLTNPSAYDVCHSPSMKNLINNDTNSSTSHDTNVDIHSDSISHVIAAIKLLVEQGFSVDEIWNTHVYPIPHSPSSNSPNSLHSKTKTSSPVKHTASYFMMYISSPWANAGVVETLMKYTEDINKRCDSGWTAIWYALTYGGQKQPLRPTNRLHSRSLSNKSEIKSLMSTGTEQKTTDQTSHQITYTEDNLNTLQMPSCSCKSSTTSILKLLLSQKAQVKSIFPSHFDNINDYPSLDYSQLDFSHYSLSQSQSTTSESVIFPNVNTGINTDTNVNNSSSFNHIHTHNPVSLLCTQPPSPSIDLKFTLSMALLSNPLATLTQLQLLVSKGIDLTMSLYPLTTTVQPPTSHSSNQSYEGSQTRLSSNFSQSDSYLSRYFTSLQNIGKPYFSLDVYFRCNPKLNFEIVKYFIALGLISDPQRNSLILDYIRSTNPQEDVLALLIRGRNITESIHQHKVWSPAQITKNEYKEIIISFLSSPLPKPEIASLLLDLYSPYAWVVDGLKFDELETILFDSLTAYLQHISLYCNSFLCICDNETAMYLKELTSPDQHSLGLNLLNNNLKINEEEIFHRHSLPSPKFVHSHSNETNRKIHNTNQYVISVIHIFLSHIFHNINNMLNPNYNSKLPISSNSNITSPRFVLRDYYSSLHTFTEVFTADKKDSVVSNIVFNEKTLRQKLKKLNSLLYSIFSTKTPKTPNDARFPTDLKYYDYPLKYVHHPLSCEPFIPAIEFLHKDIARGEYQSTHQLHKQHTGYYLPLSLLHFPYNPSDRSRFHLPSIYASLMKSSNLATQSSHIQNPDNCNDFLKSTNILNSDCISLHNARLMSLLPSITYPDVGNVNYTRLSSDEHDPTLLTHNISSLSIHNLNNVTPVDTDNMGDNNVRSDNSTYRFSGTLPQTRLRIAIMEYLLLHFTKLSSEMIHSVTTPIYAPPNPNIDPELNQKRSKPIPLRQPPNLLLTDISSHSLTCILHSYIKSQNIDQLELGVIKTILNYIQCGGSTLLHTNLFIKGKGPFENDQSFFSVIRKQISKTVQLVVHNTVDEHRNIVREYCDSLPVLDFANTTNFDFSVTNPPVYVISYKHIQLLQITIHGLLTFVANMRNFAYDNQKNIKSGLKKFNNIPPPHFLLWNSLGETILMLHSVTGPFPNFRIFIIDDELHNALVEVLINIVLNIIIQLPSDHSLEHL